MNEMTIRTARRAAENRYFLAFALHLFAENNQMDEPDLMAALGATPETLAHARLCRTPRGDAAGMKDEVARIAAKFGLNAGVLLRAVRAADVAVVQQTAAQRELPEPVAPLLAARDRPANPGSDAGGDGSGEPRQ